MIPLLLLACGVLQETSPLECVDGESVVQVSGETEKRCLSKDLLTTFDGNVPMDSDPSKRGSVMTTVWVPFSFSSLFDPDSYKTKVRYLEISGSCPVGQKSVQLYNYQTQSYQNPAQCFMSASLFSDAAYTEGMGVAVSKAMLAR